MAAGLQTHHPAQEYVAGGLHQALAINHALSVRRKRTAAGVWLEHRSVRFLDLKKQRSGLRVAEQRHLAERPDAADADDFEGHIEQIEPIEQHSRGHRERVAIPLERRCGLAPIGRGSLTGQMVDEGRMVLDFGAGCGN